MLDIFDLKGVQALCGHYRPARAPSESENTAAHSYTARYSHPGLDVFVSTWLIIGVAPSCLQ